jgi:hypothetical protein
MFKKYVYVLFALALPVLSVYGQNKPAATKTIPLVGQGILQFDYDRFDFGNVNEKGGRVFHDFRFVNNGKGPIKITNVITSCGCTHSEWTRTPINPGDSGIIRASFDPDGRQGKFDKTLTVETDGSPTNHNLVIKGHVYPAKFNFAETYKYQYGNIAVVTNNFNFAAVKSNGYDSTEIGLYNMGNKKVYVYKIETPSNILTTRPYDHMPPNTEMRIPLKYYPKVPIEYGPIRQEFRIYTNDDSLPIKRFFVTANIVEDFSMMSKKDLKTAPKLIMKSKEVDLGNVPLFNTPTAVFTIINKGKKDLIIRKIVRNCTCLIPEMEQKIIPKGKSAELKVQYSLVNMAGPDSKTLKMITNDPNNSEVTLTVKINVTE